MQKRRPVMLAILDGWGWREDPADNAVRQAPVVCGNCRKAVHPQVCMQSFPDHSSPGIGKQLAEYSSRLDSPKPPMEHANEARTFLRAWQGQAPCDVNSPAKSAYYT
jgi:hypothetical protein